MPNVPPGEVDRAVARHIIGEIGDGACLQVGIGAMPNAVTSLLAESGVRDLGVHSEMLTEGIIDDDGQHVAYLLGRTDRGQLSYQSGAGTDPTDAASRPALSDLIARWSGEGDARDLGPQQLTGAKGWNYEQGSTTPGFSATAGTCAAVPHGPRAKAIPRAYTAAVSAPETSTATASTHSAASTRLMIDMPRW